MANDSLVLNETLFDLDEESENAGEDECEGIDGCFEDIPVPPQAYYAFFGFSSFLITFGNLLVVIAILRNKKLRSSATNTLIVCLAFSDLFIGILYCPFQVVNMVLGGVQLRESYLCRGYVIFIRMSFTATTMSLLAIAVDRYRAIVQPMQPRISLTQARYISIAVWIVSFIFNSNVFVSYRIVTETWQENGQNVSHEVCDVPYYLVHIEYRMKIVYIVAIYLVPLVVLSTLYARMIITLYSGKSINDESRRRKRKAIKMLIVVVIMYALCWGPYRVHQVLYAYDESWFTDSYFILTVISFIFISNSFVNPIIYAFCNRNFRDEFILILSCGAIRPPAKSARQYSSKFTKSTEAAESSIASKGVELQETKQYTDMAKILEVEEGGNVSEYENPVSKEGAEHVENNVQCATISDVELVHTSDDTDAQHLTSAIGTQTTLG
ncbi:neuropeptide receptor-like protein 4 [Saccoglossus kowalevskii]|uniref:Neuropeptide receptor-like protein 4 n=1 Tax=Saccoglossus kowalevskii TaxID=10224 RepID=D1LX84_SACKO|nr:neuropeptide receptor-like protein 4 [Saccoglossus kowalevskii]ACY92590.1 neuropeptide receptor-like protein 4 [Saccoglossus kowalevskii]